MGRPLHRIRCLFLIVLMVSMFSLTALAAEGSAELDSLHFDIALQEDGSALITETRTIVFNGDREFTRYGVNNLFTAPRAFSDWQVSIDGTPLSQLDEPDNENRPENTFAVEDTDEGNTIYIYYRQQGSGTRIFQIGYRVENAVKLYSDVGEFFWNLTGETGISDIGTLTVTLTAPANCPTEEFLIWAHGPREGTFDKQPDGSAALRIENVPLGTIVDIRATLPADCLTGGWVQQGEALDGILAYEKELADSANAKREEEERARAESQAYWEAYWAERNVWAEQHPVLDSIQSFCRSICVYYYYDVDDQLTGIVAFFGFCIFVFSYFRGRRRRDSKELRHTPTQSPQYCRNLPDDTPAPVVDRLVHFYEGRSVVSRQISASILELALRGLVDVRMDAGEVELLLNVQQGEKLFPSPTQQEPRVPDHQETLWRFLLDAADGSRRITMKDLKQYVQDNQEMAWHYRSDFQSAVSREYKERVKTEVVKSAFFEGSKRPLLLSVVIGIIVMLIRMFSTLYDGVEMDVSITVGVIAFTLAAFMVLIYLLGRKLGKGRSEILDQQSEDALALWEAFGRFLDDFTSFEERELPEFSAWQEYMVYAVAMGRGQKVAEALRLKYPEPYSAEIPAFDDELYRMLRDMELYNAMDSIGREVAEARLPRAETSDSDSSWSDGSGGGGGFSDSGGGSDSGSGGDFID